VAEAHRPSQAARPLESGDVDGAFTGYEPGPGNFLAKVRLRSGVVQSISFGRDPR